MVAGIQAAVVFQRYPFAAELVIDAQLRVHALPLRHGSFKMIDEDSADVATVPIVPDLTRKVPQSSGSTDQSVTTESGWPGWAVGESCTGNVAGSHF